MAFPDFFIKQAMSYADANVEMVPLQKFCAKILYGLVRKYGIENVTRGVLSEEDSDVNNVLTFVIELGSIKVMHDNNLVVSDENELLKRSLGVSFSINLALASVLQYHLKLENKQGGHYNQVASSELAERVFNHNRKILNLHLMPKHVQEDTFTVNEMFEFYLGEYIR